MNFKKIVVIVLSLGLLAALYVYFFVLNKSHPNFADLEPDFVVNAADIYKEFTTDGAAASAKYNGKMVQIKGEVNKVEVADTMIIAVYVFNEGMFGDEGLRCTFLPSAEKVDQENLKGRDIKCFCSGFNDSDVIFEKCSIVK